MIDPDSQDKLRGEIQEQIESDRALLTGLRDEIRPLRSAVRAITPRSTTSLSIVATDGGNNAVAFDPFLVQLIRVVDSSNNEYCLQAVSPTSDVDRLNRLVMDTSAGAGRHPLGELMRDLGLGHVTEISPVIRQNHPDQPISPTWIQVFRELTEWATLYSIVKNRSFGTDTLIVFDGLLRSKVFTSDLFAKTLGLLKEHIDRHRREERRSVYLVGLAKHNKVLARYRLSMALEGVLTTEYPAYVEVPRDIEEKAYVWSEYARGDDREMDTAEINKFVGGKMFLVKFGRGQRDPIWPVDIFQSQTSMAPMIIGSLLQDARDGFPVPLYPRSLQKAHENAALVDFDFEILQDEIFRSLRLVLGAEAPTLDTFRLQVGDPAAARYS